MDKAMRPEGQSPRISVLMCVYNGRDYLAEAVQSVLSQTFGDFEFLIVNDGSTDDSLAMLSSFRDERIRIIDNGANLGLIRSLNIGLDAAQGAFIARMDADDVCAPDRFEKQITFLDSHPDTGLCGSWVSIIGADEAYRYPLTHEEIKLALLGYNPVAHPSVMLRSSVLNHPRIRFDHNFPGAEDYELWTRAVFATRFANLPEMLLRYRKHDKQVTQKKRDEVNASSGRIKIEMLKSLGITPDEAESKLHLLLFNDQHKELRGDELLPEADAWMNKIVSANLRHRQFDDRQLRALWRSKLFVTCIDRYDLKKWKILKKTLCYKAAEVPAGEKAKLFIKCLVRRKVG
jgi:glycosyltransferase involved in cell wall biosynthesis